MNETDLNAACSAAGIATRYVDGDGTEHALPPAALKALLERLGKNDARPLPIVVPADRANVRALQGARARLTTEAGEETALTSSDGLFHFPPLPTGYHTITLDGGAPRPVLAEPARTYMPQPWPHGRAWGLQVQLYGLRTEDGKPIGDLGDLVALGRIADEAGASFVGINPLHALFEDRPDSRSPYSPSSRLFLNPIYLDLSQIPGCEGVATGTGDELVDYATTWAAKSTSLRQGFAAFLNDANGREAFDAWRAGQGRPLETHALFEALAEAHAGTIWRDWPEDLRDPDGAGIAAFKASHADRITYAAWLQWHAARQLAGAADATPGFGLYRDLAVGADRTGSEFWAHRNVFADGVDVGAPPDGFSPAGQNWGLPPFRPMALRTPEGLNHFRALIAANMRGSGLLRIDHAFQLERLFLIPHGHQNREGTYVDYPLETLLAVLKIESHRHRCVVVAEDLGTPPEGFREAITEAGLLTYKVFYFERDVGGFSDPAAWDRTSFASVSTHDLPTLAGWWSGHDIAWRERAGQVGAGETARMEDERAADRGALAQTLGVAADNGAPNDAILARVGGAGSMLVGVQLEDVLGEVEQANLPGTLDEHPNWRRRASRTLEEAAPAIRDVGRKMREAGRDGRANSGIRATYRLQFHESFTFADAERIVPYLADLGVSHIYASPIFEAEPGSTHHYDGVDPTRISAALGGAVGFAALSRAARARGLGIIIDIVPNHLGIASDANPYWRSVLTWGPSSPHAAMFDIDWARHGPMRGKVTLPVLGGSYGNALSNGGFEVAVMNDVFVLRHGEANFPLSLRTWIDILQFAGVTASTIESVASMSAGDVLSVSSLGLANETASRAAEAITRTYVAGAAGALHRLIERQHYRLMHWRAGPDVLNYRRFFDITTLAGVRVEDEDVFALVHRGVKRLSDEGQIDGVRIDHVDGLAHPTSYLHDLRELLGADAYIIVEKILEHDEGLPPAWPVDGTSGYDALNVIDGVLVDRTSIETFDALDTAALPFEDRLVEAKRNVLDASFRGEVDRLVSALIRILRRDLATRDMTRGRLTQAVRAVLVAMPVYRTYVEGAPNTRDLAVLDLAFAKADAATRGALADVLAAFRSVLDTPTDRAAREVVRRFQQLSGPVMAKGLEDTLFYRDARLIALNEVGGAPQTFGHETDHVHRWATAQARDWPTGMIATATHDTKRGEDARTRLLALTHVPDLWLTAIGELEAIFAEGQVDETDRRIAYQAVLGASGDRDGLAGRLEGWATKALREAKRHSTWTEPNETYEAAMIALVTNLADPSHPGGALLKRVSDRVAHLGEALSLASLVLKHTLPGVPDTYQGTEVMDYALVDPDNRRPVDYPALNGADALKVRATRALLHLRRALHPLMTAGDYRPIPADQAIRYRRAWGDVGCELVVPLRYDLDGNPSSPLPDPSPGYSTIDPSAWPLDSRIQLSLTDAAAELVTRLAAKEPRPS